MPYNQWIDESPYGSTTALLRKDGLNNRISTDSESLFSDYQEKGYAETIASVDEKDQDIKIEEVSTGGENRSSTVINWNWNNTQYSLHQDVCGGFPRQPVSGSGSGLRKIMGKPDERIKPRLILLKDLFQDVSELGDIEKQDKSMNDDHAFRQYFSRDIGYLIDNLYSQVTNTISIKLKPTFRDLMTKDPDPKRDSDGDFNSTCRKFHHHERNDRHYNYLNQNPASALWMQDRRDNHNYHSSGSTSRISCIINTFHNAHIINSVKQSTHNFSIRKLVGGLPSQDKRIQFDQNQTRGTVEVEERTRTNSTGEDVGGILLTLTTNVDDKDSVCSTKLEVDWNLDARILGDDDRIWEI